MTSKARVRSPVGTAIFAALAVASFGMALWEGWQWHRHSPLPDMDMVLSIARIHIYAATAIVSAMLAVFRNLAEHYHIVGGVMVALQVASVGCIIVSHPDWTYEQLAALLAGIFAAAALFLPRSSPVGKHVLPYYVVKIAGPADF